ncbi:hypothetical protein ACGFW5_11830 [Streptomyces sp. NPDC048416]|uniref:hypothetical protein n=1 Tax=Streptomyces sp. NPDC048416 TaxID=3365546 RepID=UPI0037108912
MVGPGAHKPYEREKAEAAVDRGWTSKAGPSRLFLLCAVLFGLFSMHGAPANAVAGCHGETALTPSMSEPWKASMSEPLKMAHSAMPAERPGAHAGPVVTGASGDLCVSTPARERLPLAGGLLAVLGPAVVMARGRSGPRAALRGARRGPPLAGRGLLIQVCVART